MSNPVKPVRRDLAFHLPAEKISNWSGHGLHVSHFMNALSIFFPDGERFFIDSVRYHRDRIRNPELQESVRAFIGQEAMHGREHEEYNEALAAKGLPAERYGRVVLRLLNFFRRVRSPQSQLAGTIALEHITAILADIVLKEPRILENADPRFAALWRWHALEETEHKAVAFDVYEHVYGRGPVAYLRRCFGLLLATTIFWVLVIPFHIGLVRADGEALNLRGWARAMNHLWGSPGVLRRIVPQWLAYFRPGFHPWDHDNSRFLAQIDALADEVGGYDRPLREANA